MIVGLGNPGERYLDTRHNAGCWFADLVAARGGETFRARRAGEECRLEVAGRPLWLFKPAAFMNASGPPVAAFARQKGVAAERLLVAHDEIDFPVARVRLKRAGGAGGHNGVADVARHLGPAFWRLRIGVGRPDSAAQVVAYVLRRARAGERAAIDAALGAALDTLDALVAGNFEDAMNALHAAPPAAGAADGA